MPNLLEKAAKINLQDYKYELKEEHIAKFPLAQRDHSKLLVYKNEQVQHTHFYNLKRYLPEESTLFFNNTKVIPARIHFTKQTGASIEIFLLSAVSPTTEIAEAMLVKNKCIWHCMVGNRKRWKAGDILERFFETDYGKISVKASYADFENNYILFEWDNESVPFVEIVELMGTTPLPPYLNRDATEDDKPRYQTVYSKNEGAVAAPTAGLHFTDELIKQLKDEGVDTQYLTLHVGAGTFQPIKAENVLEHPMHCEQIQIQKSTIQYLAATENPVIAVGTTSVRSLESTYWFGVQLLKGNATDFHIGKLLPYEIGFDDLPNRKAAFQAVSDYLQARQLETLYGDTEIFIFPGYMFQVVKGLITNFHQPESTLMLLIAALLGDNWKKVYQEALNNGYRFLSFGDSSLLIP